MNEIGLIIKKRRRNMALTIDELSQIINISSASINAWETGKYKPSLRHVKKLKNVLGGELVDYIEQ